MTSCLGPLAGVALLEDRVLEPERCQRVVSTAVEIYIYETYALEFLQR